MKKKTKKQLKALAWKIYEQGTDFYSNTWGAAAGAFADGDDDYGYELIDQLFDDFRDHAGERDMVPELTEADDEYLWNVVYEHIVGGLT